MIPIFIMTIENDDDREFMVRLYTDYHALMKKQALLLLDEPSLDEDMVNEACIKLIKNIDTIKQMNSWALPSYIVLTVRSVVFDHLKSKRSEKVLEIDEIEKESAEDSLSAETEALRRIEINELASLINKLPDKLRDVLNFKYFLNMTNKEIASNLGIKTESVNMYLTRARRKIAEMYEGKDVTKHD